MDDSMRWLPETTQESVAMDVVNNEKLYVFDVQMSRRNKHSVVLFCKKNTGETVCIPVHTINRKVYIHCKQFTRYEDCLQEVIQICDGFETFCKISKQFEQMEYCFDSSIDVEVDRGMGDYIVVEYSYAVDINFSNSNLKQMKCKYIDYVFGYEETIVKAFLMQSGLGGCCFIELDESLSVLQDSVRDKHTLCKNEYCAIDFADVKRVEVEHGMLNIEKQINTVFSCMVVRVLTCYNNKKRQKEIFAIQCIPTGLQAEAKLFVLNVFNPTLASTDSIIVCRSEKFVLQNFITFFSEIDPDVVMGHNLYHQDMKCILDRCIYNKITSVNRLFRIVRFYSGEISLSGILEGRMICDTWDFLTKKNAGKQIDCNLKTYRLEECVNTITNTQFVRRTDPYGRDVSMFACDDTYQYMFQCLQEECTEIINLEKHLSILRLTNNISVYCQCPWNLALISTGSVIIEYMFLQEFYKRKLVIPDKSTTNKRNQKSQYSGGLIIDSCKGIHDTPSKLLDISSLYPSVAIKQQLCFSAQLNRKFLYKKFKHLIDKRKEVKDDKVKQYALKLCVNKIYGLLGMSDFRFHRRDLASSITQEGREILQNVIAIAQRNGFGVLYGHTDSMLVSKEKTTISLNMEVQALLSMIHSHYANEIMMKVDGSFERIAIFKNTQYAALCGAWHSKIKPEEFVLTGMKMLAKDSTIMEKQLGYSILTKMFSQKEQKQIERAILTVVTKSKNKLKERPFEDFIVVKRLGKNIRTLTSKDPYNKQPHVVVGKWLLSQRESVNKGDMIEFIVCRNDNIVQYMHPLQYQNVMHRTSIDYIYYTDRLARLAKLMCQNSIVFDKIACRF